MGPRAAAQPDPAAFDAVLAERARAGGFDYRGATGQDKKRLAAYLSNLGDADPAAMSPDERKAFLINAYNAMAIVVVLERYPVASIMDIDGAFKSIRKRIGREMLTLDEIENRLRDTRDARIHFAIVCASRSCPPLAPKAYRAEGLSAALEAQGRAFVNDRTRNVLDRSGGETGSLEDLRLEPQGVRAGRRVASEIRREARRGAVSGSWVETFPRPPEFLEYDWALNQP